MSLQMTAFSPCFEHCISPSCLLPVLLVPPCAFHHGYIFRYAYLAPHRFNKTASGYSSRLVRIDDDDFTSTGVTVFDVSTASPALRGFGGAIAHGATLVLPPYANGNFNGANINGANFNGAVATFNKAGGGGRNEQGRAQSSVAAVIDLDRFGNPHGVTALDLAWTPRQQVRAVFTLV